MKKRVVVIGAAGRDFHNFNVFFREDEEYEVVAFTATQIPNIEDRTYPPILSGAHYPNGIPIVPESDLETVIRQHAVDFAVFSYSDVSYEHVMGIGARVLSAGAGFLLLSPEQTMISSTVPVVSVCATRTGTGKSQTSRRIASILREAGKHVVVVRHPMPYGDLARQGVQRFETVEDLNRHQTTIEEREEYEPHISRGCVVFAGSDYEAILREAEREADIVIWDGGNNDFSFFRPDLLITVMDPHRAGHSRHYYPGEINVRMADVVVINKVDSATEDQISEVEGVARSLNPTATILHAASPVTVDDPSMITDKRVLVIEDGPTLTHGGMSFGAGCIAAESNGATEIVDPRPFAVGSIAETFEKYPTTGAVLPAMGYGEQQIRDLEATINRADVDLVLVATPIDLTRVLKIEKPSTRVRYRLEQKHGPSLESILQEFLEKASTS